jgi:glycosyltransferase involved in cell wall biosynthesis
METFLDKRKVWIINPYGSLPAESWATYRSTMLAESLAGNGYIVTQFISNFEHRSKTYRSQNFKVLTISRNYSISIIPSTAYADHISIARIQYERTFAKNLLKSVKSNDYPDFIVLAEPSLFYYNILLKPLIIKSKCILILDIIDIWPELFELAIPKKFRIFSGVLLAPFYYWRNRLYKYPKAIVAVAYDYLNIAKKIVKGKNTIFEVVYWSYYDTLTKQVHTENDRIKTLVEKKRADELWLIYAGTLGENYDIKSILWAANKLTEELVGKANFKFIIAGDGPLKQLCKDNESDNFVFLGRLAAEELKLLYQHSDLALSTYKGESTVAMPIKAFDYISFGLPMVNSLGRDLGQLIEKHGLGVNYDPNSPDSLLSAIKQLIFDSSFREKCSKNAITMADEFRAERQYEKFVMVLEKLK